MDVGKTIRDKRAELGLTLDEVAAALGVSKSTVLRYETGEIANMGIDKLEALAKILKMKPVELLGWNGKPEPRDEAEAVVMVKKEATEAVELVNQLAPEDMPLAVQMLKRLAKRE